MWSRVPQTQRMSFHPQRRMCLPSTQEGKCASSIQADQGRKPVEFGFGVSSVLIWDYLRINFCKSWQRLPWPLLPGEFLVAMRWLGYSVHGHPKPVNEESAWSEWLRTNAAAPQTLPGTCLGLGVAGGTAPSQDWSLLLLCWNSQEGTVAQGGPMQHSFALYQRHPTPVLTHTRSRASIHAHTPSHSHSLL